MSDHNNNRAKPQLSLNPLFPFTLYRYVIAEINGNFLVCLLAFTGILLTLRLLQFTSLIINKHVAAYQIALVFLSLIPTFLEIALPLATLLGVMLTYARLSGDSEIVVMRASGVSVKSLLIPAVCFGGIVAIMSLFISNFGKPAGFRLLNQTFFEIAQARSTAGLSPGIFNSLGAIILYCEEIKDKTGELQKVLIEDKRALEARQIIIANKGRITSDKSNQTIVVILEDGYIHQNIAGKYVVTKFDTNQIILEPKELTSSDESQRGRRARELTLHELNSSIELLRNHLSTDFYDQKELNLDPLILNQMRGKEITFKTLSRKLVQLKVEKTFRYAVPFSCLLLASIAVPFGISPSRLQRSWGAGLSTILGMAIFITYYALLSIGMTLAESSILSPHLGVWLPNIGLVVLIITLLRKNRLEANSSVAELVEHSIKRIVLLIRGVS